MDLLQTIQLHEKDFSKTELKVYQYILEHPETVETYTISKIASMSNTSTSAVLRFCQVLGFNGYKDFRFEMINYLRQRQQSLDPLDYLQQLCGQYINIMNQLTTINRTQLDQLISDLKGSNSIYITGIHYSSLPAKALMMGLQDLRIMSYFASDYMEISHLLNTVKDDDIIVNFSISGNGYSSMPILSDLSTSLPNSSYLITLNSQQKKTPFQNTIVLPGRDLTRQSVLDTQSIPMIFVEILLNLLHNSF